MYLNIASNKGTMNKSQYNMKCYFLAAETVGVEEIL